MEENNKNKKIIKVFAIIGLVIIFVLIGIIIYSLITQNGRLAFAMIFALIFLSVLYWGIKVVTDFIRKRMR